MGFFASEQLKTLLKKSLHRSVSNENLRYWALLPNKPIITLEFRFYYEKRAGIFPVMPNPQGRHYEEAIYRADYDSTVFHYACPIGQA